MRRFKLSLVYRRNAPFADKSLLYEPAHRMGDLQIVLSFDDALKIAQELGYAETKDPSDDVDGRDACRKIAILSSMVCGCIWRHCPIPATASNIRRNPSMPTSNCLSGWQKLHGTPGPN